MEREAPAHTFTFKGDGGGYFLICLVNTLLCIITLGVYFPWALMKCRRYIYSNMYLNGQSFSYKVTGGDIFLSWFLLMVIYITGLVTTIKYPVIGLAILGALLLSVPVLFTKSLQYQAIQTSLNGVRFGFRCGALRAFWNLLALPGLLVVAFGGVMVALALLLIEGSGNVIFLAVALALTWLIGLIVISGLAWHRLMLIVGEGGSFGIHRFRVQVSLRYCIKTMMIGAGILVPFFALMGYMTFSLCQSIIGESDAGLSSEQVEMLIYTRYYGKYLLIQLVYIFGVAVMSSYLAVAFRNHFLNNLQLADGQIRFRSTLTWHGMVYRLGALLVISAISCGLAWPLLRVWLIGWVAENTSVVGDLDALELTDSDEVVDNGLLSRLSRGVMPGLIFI
ncbi:YjgN family protein [Intestinirhabdus alba]|nr:DUF898 family protein [Intestinirhabdus alba]